jgi:hypothetical protein
VEPTSPEARKAALQNNVRNAIARGARIESQTEFDAVVVYGKPVNHVLHLLISIFTCSVWAFIGWIPVVIFGGERREMIAVDEFGVVASKKLGRR